MSNGMELEELPGDHFELASVYRLRVLCWRTQLNIAQTIDIWQDGFDHCARHWVVRKGGAIIASARLTAHENINELPDAQLINLYSRSWEGPFASMNRCVVHPEHRGNGVALMLDVARINAARNAGCRTVFVIAATPARSAALRALNFTFLGAAPPDSCGLLQGTANLVHVLAV